MQDQDRVPQDAAARAAVAGHRIVVVMPAYNAAQTLERTYADIPHDLVGRIVLVDDVSRDQTVEIAKRLGTTVGTVKSWRNRGRFPDPLVTHGPAWEWAEIEKWRAARQK